VIEPPICEGVVPVTEVSIKITLEGAYDAASGLMRTDLQDNSLLPFSHPYFRPPYLYFDELETLENLPNNVVDWVLVEARTAPNEGSMVERKIALVRNDGLLINRDGNEFIGFHTLNENEPYYFVIRHRNHLDVMTATPLSVPNATYDFTTAATQAYGPNQLKMMNNGTYAMYVGDYSGDGVINVFDFNAYGTELGFLNSYLTADGNMDKTVNISDFNIYQPNASVIGVDEVRY